MIELASYISQLPLLILVTGRLAGVVLIAPAFGHSAVPLRIRIFISLVLSIAVVAQMPGGVALPTQAYGMLLMLAVEILIGAAMGFAVRFMFVAIELGAFHIGQQMGIGLVEALNPLAGGDSSDVMRRLFEILAVVIFLAIGGHRQLIAAALGTFQTVPPMKLIDSTPFLQSITLMFSASFILAIKVAAPVVVVMLLTTVALAMLQKTLPQCNILSTGLGVRAVIGLLVVVLTLAALPQIVEVGWSAFSEGVNRALETLRY